MKSRHRPARSSARAPLPGPPLFCPGAPRCSPWRPLAALPRHIDLNASPFVLPGRRAPCTRVWPRRHAPAARPGTLLRSLLRADAGSWEVAAASWGRGWRSAGARIRVHTRQRAGARRAPWHNTTRHSRIGKRRKASGARRCGFFSGAGATAGAAEAGAGELTLCELVPVRSLHEWTWTTSPSVRSLRGRTWTTSPPPTRSAHHSHMSRHPRRPSILLQFTDKWRSTSVQRIVSKG